MERLGGLHGVLAGHRVDDEERVVGRHCTGDQPDLLHHLGVDRESTGGVDDDDVATEALRLFDTLERGEDRVVGVGVDGHIDLAAEGAELLDGGGALEVGTHEERLTALRLEPAARACRWRWSCRNPADRPSG